MKSRMKIWMVAGLSLVVGACGFQLRGAGPQQAFDIKELSVTAANSYGATVKEVKTALEDRGVQVTGSAPYKLIIVDESSDTRTVGYTGSTRAAEAEMTMKLEYEIRGPGNLVLIQDTVDTISSYSIDDNNIVASQLESSSVIAEQRNNLIQQLLMRLQVLHQSRLDELQKEAEAKIKAEAERMRLEAEQATEQDPQAPPSVH